MGPAVDKAQLETDLEYIEIGTGRRARPSSAAAASSTEGALAHGHFVEPTVFDHVKMSMRIAQEEIFGPVIAVIRVKDFEEAMTAANDVRFGLSSSIFTTDATTRLPLRGPHRGRHRAHQQRHARAARPSSPSAA